MGSCDAKMPEVSAVGTKHGFNLCVAQWLGNAENVIDWFGTWQEPNRGVRKWCQSHGSGLSEILRDSIPPLEIQGRATETYKLVFESPVRSWSQVLRDKDRDRDRSQKLSEPEKTGPRPEKTGKTCLNWSQPKITNTGLDRQNSEYMCEN